MHIVFSDYLPNSRIHIREKGQRKISNYPRLSEHPAQECRSTSALSLPSTAVDEGDTRTHGRHSWSGAHLSACRFYHVT